MGDWRDQQDRLERAWDLVRGWCELAPPAPIATIQGFEQTRGARLPAETKALLQRHNGVQIVDNTFIDPIPVSDVYAHSTWNAEIYERPDWLVPFAHNGGDSVYGLCLLTPARDTAPVLELVDYAFERRCVYVEARSMTEMLMVRTAYYLLLNGDVWQSEIPHVRARGDLVTESDWRLALDVLGIPSEYVRFADDDEHDYYDTIRDWMWPLRSELETNDWSAERWVGYLKHLEPD